MKTIEEIVQQFYDMMFSEFSSEYRVSLNGNVCRIYDKHTHKKLLVLGDYNNNSIFLELHKTIPQKMSERAILFISKNDIILEMLWIGGYENIPKNIYRLKTINNLNLISGNSSNTFNFDLFDPFQINLKSVFINSKITKNVYENLKLYSFMTGCKIMFGSMVRTI